MRSPEGKLTLFCKGADTIIYERLHPSCRGLMDVTSDHLNVSAGPSVNVHVVGVHCSGFKVRSNVV